MAFVRRQYWPLLLALGALALATMAAARYSSDYYFAPAFAVAIPGALWIFKRPRTSTVPVYLWVPVAALLVWTVSNVQSWEQRQDEEIDSAAQALADELLQPGEVILATHYYFPVEDVRYDTLVDGFVDHVPEYPYRFIHRPRTAAERGLVPRYVSAPDAELPPPGTTASLDVGGDGPFVVEGLDKRRAPATSIGWRASCSFRRSSRSGRLADLHRGRSAIERAFGDRGCGALCAAHRRAPEFRRIRNSSVRLRLDGQP